MDIKQIEKELKEDLNEIGLCLRTTVKKAIHAGGLLCDAKKQLGHGYTAWLGEQKIAPNSAWRYERIYTYRTKLSTVEDLASAYQLIESEENKRKREEFEAQTKRVNEYKKTGNKPDGWNEKTDAVRIKKEKEDAEYTERKRQYFEERQKKIEQGKKGREEKTNVDDTHEKKILDGLENLSKAIEEKERLLSKMRLTGNNAKEPIYDALLEYLLGLDTSTRLEACHNIIKFCKGIAAELQKQSMKSIA